MKLKLFPTFLPPTFWRTLLRRLMGKNLTWKRSLTPKVKTMKRKKARTRRTKLKISGWKKKANPKPLKSPRR